MDIRDQIDYYLNTAFKRVNVSTPNAGHNLIELAEWNRTDGFIKKDTAKYGDVVVPCPVIAIVDTKIRESNLTLTITGKVAAKTGTETFNQIGREITKDVYGTSATTIQTTFDVPRFTRTGATFLLSGLENKIYEITNITENVDVFGQRGGKIKFYGLASDGAKVLWLLGMYKIHNTIKEIINSIWVVPTVCPYCNATGIDPDTGDTCPQCLSYGYSGYNAEKGIQIDKGYDVRLTREKFSEYPVSDANNAKIWKFVNEIWTQKWWVTPTITDIKKLFAHFYNVRQEDIIITERYHFSMPHWQIDLPLETQLGSPFDAGDTNLARFIAESVTPAGVNVFVGFYTTRFLGNLDDLLEQEVFTLKVKPKILSKRMWEIGSLSYKYDDWNSRFRCYNGWNEAVDSFEVTGVALSGIWQTSGAVDIFNANDQFRHVARLKGNGSSMIYDSSGFGSGHIEFWIHPETSNLRCSILTSGLSGIYWLEYNQSQTGFVEPSGLLLNIYPDNEAHVRIAYVPGGHYNGIYSFKYDANGIVPSGWIDSSTGTCTIEVIGLKWNHNKVVELDDDDGSGIVDFKQVFTAGAQDFGTLEFWIAFDEKTDIELSIELAGTIRFIIREDDWYYETFGPPGQSVIPGIVATPQINTWQHIQIFWRGNSAAAYKGLNQNNYKVVIDGDTSSVIAGGPFTDVSDIRIFSTNAYTGTIWLDAVGYVWDSGYNEGDNLTRELQRRTFINKVFYSSGYELGTVDLIKFHNTTVGTGFIDGFGITSVSGYTKNKNFQTLYPWGWGLNHVNCLSGVSGLYEKYFLPDRPFNINISGVCQ